MDEAKSHILKTWPEYMDSIVSGEKMFELRKNDRDFQVGDVLILVEYDPGSKLFLKREVQKRITYILEGPAFGLKEGYCIMSLVDIV